MTELRNLRGRINELESDLRDRDEEVKLVKDQQFKLHTVNGSQDESETVRVSLAEKKIIFTPRAEALGRPRILNNGR